MDDIFGFNRNHDDNYYKILGCDRLSDVDQIMKEYRLRAIKCHPDKKPEDEQATQEFEKLQRAKEILTDTENRKQYDKWLDSGISLPFEKWLNISRNVHTSLHWMNRRLTNPMITYQEENQLWKPNQFKWERDYDDEVLRKFRNYEL